MNIKQLIKEAERVAVDHSPAILTAIGVAGTLTTAYLTGKAAYRCALIVDDDERIQGESATFKDIFLMTWKEYVPAGATAVLTVTCIVGANRIGTRRTAALAAAYSVSERAYSEYRDKVVEQHGKNKELKVRESIAQDHVDAHPPVSSQIIMTGDGNVLCMDDLSGRYFRSTMETIKKAQNDLNYKMLSNDHASLADFYGMLDIPCRPNDAHLGWRSDNRLELSFHGTLVEVDGKTEPCMVVAFMVEPFSGFYNTH